MRDSAPTVARAPASLSLMKFLRGSAREGTAAWQPGDVWVARRSEFKNLKWSLTLVGVLTFMFVVLTFRVDIGDVAVALALLGIVFQRGKIVFPPFFTLLALFVGWCLLGLLTTNYPFVVQRDTLLLAKMSLIWLAAINALRTRSQLRFFLIFCVFLYATHPVRGAIFNAIIYGQTQNGRFVWLNAFGNTNALASFTILYLSMAAAIVVAEKKGVIRFGAQICTVVFTTIVFLTQSRGGVLGLAVFGGLLLLGQKKKARFLLVGAAVVVGGSFFVPADAWSRLGQVVSITRGGSEVLESLDDAGSARERWEILRVASAVIADNPVTGVGWGAYPVAHYNYVMLYKSDFDWFKVDRVKPMDAHNTFVSILAESGWVGFGLFFLAVGLAIARSERIRRRWASSAPLAARQITILQMGFVGFMVSGVFATLSGYTYFYIHLTLIWVAAEILDQDMKALAEASSRASTTPAKRPSGPEPRSSFGQFDGPAPTTATPGS